MMTQIQIYDTTLRDGAQRDAAEQDEIPAGFHAWVFGTGAGDQGVTETSLNCEELSVLLLPLATARPM